MKSINTLPHTVFLMCLPLSFNAEIANNPWMKELDNVDRQPNQRVALTQWLTLYQTLASDGLVYVLPSFLNSRLQDLTFVANVGSVLPHLSPKDAVILSNFQSEPRQGEEDYAEIFFKTLGYKVYVPVTKFEGEADLKHLYANVYLGGYGIRTQLETHLWIEEQLGAKIVPLRTTDPYLYHLDCSVFPLTEQKTIVCVDVFTPKEIKEIENVTEIIPVTKIEALSGICNSVRSHNVILNHSNIHHLKSRSAEYDEELQKNRKLEDIANSVAFEVSFINISEFMKGGALLSCMVMHLNRFSYSFAPALEKAELITSTMHKNKNFKISKSSITELTNWLSANKK